MSNQTTVTGWVTAFRVDNKKRDGSKMWVCGGCVDEDEAKDAGKFSAHYRCEKCGEQYGNKNAADLAEKLLARICPVTAKRLAGLSAFSGL